MAVVGAVCSQCSDVGTCTALVDPCDVCHWDENVNAADGCETGCHPGPFAHAAACATCRSPDYADCTSLQCDSPFMDTNADVFTDGCERANCLGTWSVCAAYCSAGADRTWTTEVVPTGGGDACPTVGPNCIPGDGACTAYINCEGEWSECTAACETADQRTWTTTTAAVGAGAPCPQATNCVFGTGGCVDPFRPIYASLRTICAHQKNPGLSRLTN